jgi:hypothetical protein
MRKKKKKHSTQNEQEQEQLHEHSIQFNFISCMLKSKRGTDKYFFGVFASHQLYQLKRKKKNHKKKNQLAKMKRQARAPMKDGA